MKLLNSISIETSKHVDIMRHIYNDNLDMLATVPIPFRTYEEQQEWWNSNKSILKAFLYESVEKRGNFVAFAVLTNRGNFYTPIIAIKKEEWGKGYGKEIILDYIEKANGPLAGSQLQSNSAICHLNAKIGWQIVGQVKLECGSIDLLYHPGKNPNIEAGDTIYLQIIDYLKNKYSK